MLEINPLYALRKKKLLNFIKKRIMLYSKFTQNDYKIDFEVLEVLSSDLSDYRHSLKEVYKRFPQIIKHDSLYGRSLKSFRKRKTAGLSKKLSKLIIGKYVFDFGGQTDDLANEIIKMNTSIKKYFINGINTEKKSRNKKIIFLDNSTSSKVPLKNKSINTLIVNLTLHHLDYNLRTGLLNEFYRILKDDGNLLIIEDSYEAHSKKCDDSLTNEFLKFSTEDKFYLLAFFDWYGNRIVRSHQDVPLPFTFETFETFNRLFYNYNFSIIHKEIVKVPKGNFDLMPPKIIFKLKKDKPLNFFKETERIKIMENVLVDATRNRRFPFGPLSKVSARIIDKQLLLSSQANNYFGQQHAERIAIIDAFQRELDFLKKNSFHPRYDIIQNRILKLRALLKTSVITDEIINEYAILRDLLGNPLNRCSIFVNLEPCNNCAQVIINSGLKKLVYGVKDAHPNGKLANSNLLKGNIEIYSGVCEKQSRKQNRIPFFLLKYFFTPYEISRKVHKKVYEFINKKNFRIWQEKLT